MKFFTICKSDIIGDKMALTRYIAEDTIDINMIPISNIVVVSGRFLFTNLKFIPETFNSNFRLFYSRNISI